MKGKIILILIVATLLGGVFYWFEWRPSQIRKECAQKVQELIKGKTGLSSYDVSSLLDFCITKQGLE